MKEVQDILWATFRALFEERRLIEKQSAALVAERDEYLRKYEEEAAKPLTEEQKFEREKNPLEQDFTPDVQPYENAIAESQGKEAGLTRAMNVIFNQIP